MAQQQLGGRPRVFGRLQRKAATDAVRRAQGIADQPFKPYTGEMVAGFNPVQLGAQNRALDFSTAGIGSGTMGQAVNLANQAGSYTPTRVNANAYAPAKVAAPQQVQAVNARPVDLATYNPATVTNAQASLAGPATQVTASSVDRSSIRDVSGGGSATREQIDQYLNPYTESVVDLNLADIMRQKQIQGSLDDAAARKAKAFGGTGAAVARTLGGESYDRQAALTSANLRSQGFTTALGAAQTDLGRNLQAGIANQGVDLSVAGQNAGFGQQASIFNAGAANDMTRFNAGNEQAVNLANAGASNTAALDAARGSLSAAQGNQQAGLSLSLADAANASRAQEFNAAGQNTVNLADAAATNRGAEFNATQDMEAQRANQQAEYQAASLALDSSAALATLSGQQRAQILQDIAVAGSVGDAQQALRQRMNDAQFAEFMREVQDQYVKQNMLNATIGGFPISTVATTGERNQLMNDIGSTAQTLASLNFSSPASFFKSLGGM